MKSSRLFLCILLAFLIVYLALPRLPFSETGGLGAWFAYAWIAFALLVLGGNVYGWLVERDKENQQEQERNRETKAGSNRGRKKVRETY
ncbi:hypothetical protein CR205_01015 [Alteribacter lacisalsi]|uniref:Uncharacterized protein n=1 Tax=Alteribacter lacisalsi TaxID=2045244 RepID=A0A2W0H5U6_9BACI|nr:hypothetical protein [Alteribacter lacisalsi]PYZ97214.1 hypothetical protein CR205_01015 [Alteribacter lacisalsi]